MSCLKEVSTLKWVNYKVGGIVETNSTFPYIREVSHRQSSYREADVTSQKFKFVKLWDRLAYQKEQEKPMNPIISEIRFL